MMYLDTLRDYRQSAASAYYWFLMEQPKCSDCVFAFFEGFEDPSFYGQALLAWVSDPNKLRIRVCRGKEAVYETRKKIRQHAPGPWMALFFVDKDLSEILGEAYPLAADVYTTDYYSIENYLVTEAVFFRVWHEFVSMIQPAPNAPRCMDLFQSRLTEFHARIRPIMSWIVYKRRNGERPNLNDVNLGKLMHFDARLRLRVRRDWRQVLEKTCGTQSPKGCKAAIQMIDQELQVREPKTYIRGKFELWFFVTLIDKMVAHLNSAGTGRGTRVKYDTKITVGNAIQVLGPRVEPVASLKAFLSRNFTMRAVHSART